MKKIIFLRGVTPTGTNRIPKMSYLVEILTEVGFLNVQTYIQSGNILLESELSDEEIRKLVHDTILDKIGADLSIIIKEINQLEIAIQENPFDNTYDSSRIHLVFTNEEIPESTLTELSRENFGDEEVSTTALPHSTNNLKPTIPMRSDRHLKKSFPIPIKTNIR